MRDRTLPIIYFALLGSIGIYGVLAFVLTSGGSGLSFDELLKQPIVIPLYVVAVAEYPAAFAISRLLKRKGRPARVYFIVRWALLEAIAILGIMAALLTHDVRAFLPLLALSLLGFARSAPRERGEPLS
jgi:hypothetical protein